MHSFRLAAHLYEILKSKERCEADSLYSFRMVQWRDPVNAQKYEIRPLRKQIEHHCSTVCSDRLGIVEEDDILYLMIRYELCQIAVVIAVINDIQVLIMIYQPRHKAVSKGFFQNETGGTVGYCRIMNFLIGLIACNKGEIFIL